MANEEHLAILKQGVEVWNKWREANPDVRPDLSKTNLYEADLRWANLSETNLSKVNLGRADLSWADLSVADLVEANLIRTNLSETNLSWANLTRASLWMADFRESNFMAANLREADLHSANLVAGNLRETDLHRTDLNGTKVGWCTFGNVNLSETKGLETVEHEGPSTIGIDTLQRSQGKIPEAFLQRCGLSNWQIELAKLFQEGLSREQINDILYRVHDLRVGQSIQISPLFISYSHADGDFVDVMEEHLDNRGIRFWRDVHHATAGRLETQIDRAIRHNPTVLLVLSENSVRSDWAQHEARLARELEIETERDVLCPVALDDSWKTCRWPKRLREQIMEYNILDFSHWENDEAFAEMFGRLIDGLGLFYEWGGRGRPPDDLNFEH